MVQDQAHTVRAPRLIADRRDSASRNAGNWRGPTQELWVRRLLRGAPLPRRSTGLHPGRIARG